MMIPIVVHRRLGRVVSRSIRCFSTSPNNDAAEKQVFDKAIFEVGEWDPETRTNPLYRPKFTGTPRVISADDFARRPSVGFTGEFNSLEDGMVILSWLDDSQQKKIYDMYINLLLQSEKNNEKTSHEYAIRKIASQVRLTEERVAAVVQLQHNEQQMKQEGLQLNEELSQYMDKAIHEEIKAAYSIQRGKFATKTPPKSFVEDPVGVAGLKDTKRYVAIDDLIQFDENAENKAEMERAREIIDSHRYIEDDDDKSIDITIDKQCKSMLNANLPHPDDDATVQKERKKGKQLPKYRETRADGTKRPRWKFVCQMVDSRKEPFQMNSPKNTLVEQDGVLRAGKLSDVRETSWKPIRHVQEFTYGDAKKAWLNRIKRNQMDGWGYAREKPKENVKKEITADAAEQPDSLAEDVDEGDEQTPAPKEASNSESKEEASKSEPKDEATETASKEEATETASKDAKDIGTAEPKK